MFLSLPVVKCQLWPHVNISHLSFGLVSLSATQTHPLLAQHLGYLVRPVRRCSCWFIYKRQMSVFPSCNKAMMHGILHPGTRSTSCTSAVGPKLYIGCIVFTVLFPILTGVSILGGVGRAISHISLKWGRGVNRLSILTIFFALGSSDSCVKRECAGCGGWSPTHSSGVGLDAPAFSCSQLFTIKRIWIYFLVSAVVLAITNLRSRGVHRVVAREWRSGEQLLTS